MTHAIVTERLTKYYGSRCVVNCLDLRVPAGTVYGFLGETGPASRRRSRCCWGWPSPATAGSSSWATRSPRLPPEVRGRIAYLAEGHPLYGWMTVAEAVRFARSFHADRWNQRAARPDSRPLRDPRASEAPPAVERPAGQRRPGPGDRPRSRSADPRRPHAGPGHGRPPRFLDVDDPSRSAPGADDPVQLAYPGRRRAGRRSDRHPGRRRVARRLSHGTLQAKREQGGARVPGPAAGVSRLCGARPGVGGGPSSRAGDRQLRRRPAPGDRIARTAGLGRRGPEPRGCLRRLHPRAPAVVARFRRGSGGRSGPSTSDRGAA